MNKNACITTITLRSRTAICRIFDTKSKTRLEADCSHFVPKPIKLHGQILVGRGLPGNGRRNRTKIVDLFSPWGDVVKLQKQGFRVLVQGYKNTTHTRQFVPYVD